VPLLIWTYRSPGHRGDGRSAAEIFVGRSSTVWFNDKPARGWFGLLGVSALVYDVAWYGEMIARIR